MDHLGFTNVSMMTLCNSNTYIHHSHAGQYGICIFSNETACEEWTFLRSQCDTTHPNFAVYCADNGGELSQESVDWGEVEGAPAAEYEVCNSNGESCTDYDYYALNSCSLVPSEEAMCAAEGGTSRVMGTVVGNDYTLCSFGSDYACEMGKLMSGECDATNPSLISYCAGLGGVVSLGGIEPLEYEVCTVDGLECIEEDYYLNNHLCAALEQGPPENDDCSNATVISPDRLGTVYNGTVAKASWSDFEPDPRCGAPGKGVWYVIKGVEGGTDLRLTCTYVGCSLMTTNTTLGECPSMFLCPSSGQRRSGDDYYHYFSTEEDGIYYIHIRSTELYPGPEYSLLVEEMPEPTPFPTPAPTSPTPIPTNPAYGLTGVTVLHSIMFVMLFFTI